MSCTRHSFITWALESGTPIKRVSEWVGASVSVIERTYAHVMPQVAPDLSLADMGVKWGGMGMITPFSDTDKETEVSDHKRKHWRAGRDSRAAFGCEGFATRSVARNPRPSGSKPDSPSSRRHRKPGTSDT